MSYELKKPITDKEKNDFIVCYNHNQNLKIEDTKYFLFALEKNEIMGEKEIEIKEPEYDEEGHQTGFHIETIKIPYPIIDPDYEKKQEQKEKERIQALTCTKRVFALILQEKGVGYSQLKNLISENEQAQLEWDLCEKLERKNPLFDIMAQKLGYTSDDIDNIFVKANM